MRARAYAGDRDAAAIRAMVADAWSLVGPHFECAVGDVEWRLRRAVQPERDLQLWLDDAGVAAVAWFLPNGYVDLLVHPRARGVVEGEMIAWSRARRADGLTLWSLESNTSLVGALEGAGLARGDGVYLLLHRELSAESVPEVELASGHVVRAVSEGEIDARVEVHRAAFAPSKLTSELYHRVMGSPEYRPELDLVAVDGSGVMRAFVLGWLDRQNALGLFEPVGTHPDARRLGLARAVGAEALRRLERLGARRAIVGALSGDERSLRLYESLGFRVVDRTIGFVDR
jgi:ribosomal protein S18 acetylase RimI-like enzyme